MKVKKSLKSVNRKTKDIEKIKVPQFLFEYSCSSYYVTFAFCNRTDHCLYVTIEIVASFIVIFIYSKLQMSSV